MTPEGFERLAAEFNDLRNVVRPKVVEAIATAAAEGDRSENAEYIYGKKRLRELDKRLRYLGELLKDVQIIDARTHDGSRLGFGLTAVVADENGHNRQFTIVGEGEAEPEHGRISWKSPVGAKLLGKAVGDIVTINRPAGGTDYEILQNLFK